MGCAATTLLGDGSSFLTRTPTADRPSCGFRAGRLVTTGPTGILHGGTLVTTGPTKSSFTGKPGADRPDQFFLAGQALRGRGPLTGVPLRVVTDVSSTA